MKSVIITTVRAEIEHDEPFANRSAILEYAQEILDYAGIPLGPSSDERCSLVAVGVVEDEVEELNLAGDSE